MKVATLPSNGRDYISTYSGQKFNLETCDLTDIPLEDIAHALAYNCRYNGHVSRFYSVAEHSVIVSLLVPEEDAMEALLHDATEAFVPDVPRPLKPFITGFKEYEDKIAEEVARVYKLRPEPESVKHIDRHIVSTEARVLFKEAPAWVDLYEDVCPTWMIHGLHPDNAEAAFLERFDSIECGYEYGW